MSATMGRKSYAGKQTQTKETTPRFQERQTPTLKLEKSAHRSHARGLHQNTQVTNGWHNARSVPTVFATHHRLNLHACHQILPCLSMPHHCAASMIVSGQEVKGGTVEGARRQADQERQRVRESGRSDPSSSALRETGLMNQAPNPWLPACFPHCLLVQASTSCTSACKPRMAACIWGPTGAPPPQMVGRLQIQLFQNKNSNSRWCASSQPACPLCTAPLVLGILSSLLGVDVPQVVGTHLQPAAWHVCS
jgi:hypothetical protein